MYKGFALYQEFGFEVNQKGMSNTTSLSDSINGFVLEAVRRKEMVLRREYTTINPAIISSERFIYGVGCISYEFLFYPDCRDVGLSIMLHNKSGMRNKRIYQGTTDYYIQPIELDNPIIRLFSFMNKILHVFAIANDLKRIFRLK